VGVQPGKNAFSIEVVIYLYDNFDVSMWIFIYMMFLNREYLINKS